MYYPYMRGKQFELIAIRENAHRLGESVVPIIEPVKSEMRRVRRALEALIEHGCQFIVVANPRCGDFEGGDHYADLHAELGSEYLSNYDNWSAGYLADTATTQDEIGRVSRVAARVSVVHVDYPSGADLAGYFQGGPRVLRHIFIEGSSRRLLYRRHFADVPRSLVRDGFVTRRNKDYRSVPVEPFSDLHITFAEEGMSGFGDFLTVGREFTERGGAAHAVAIHLTFIDNAEDGAMFVRHYVSDRVESPSDPAGKFAEALTKLVTDVTQPGALVRRTQAVEEFIGLHEERHFPGLGYVKKLSMQHHIELMCSLLGN